MIDISPEHIVRELRSSSGRFLLLTNIDLPAGHPLPWSGATLDTGSDAFGLVVRLDGGPTTEGWTAADLLFIAHARAKAEEARRLGPLAVDAGRHLALALAACKSRQHARRPLPALLPGPLPSAYPWTEAVKGGHVLPLCPDPAGTEEGITPELLLMLVVELLADGMAAFPADRHLATALAHTRSALAFEVRRVALPDSGR